FQAASSAVARLPRFGINQRIVVVAPTRASANGATSFFNHDFPGRPSESAKARNSKSGESCSIAKRKLFTFSPQPSALSAITTCALVRALAATRFTIEDAGSDSEASTKKVS